MKMNENYFEYKEKLSQMNENKWKWMKIILSIRKSYPRWNIFQPIKLDQNQSILRHFRPKNGHISNLGVFFRKEKTVTDTNLALDAPLLENIQIKKISSLQSCLNKIICVENFKSRL